MHCSPRVKGFVCLVIVLTLLVSDIAPRSMAFGKMQTVRLRGQWLPDQRLTFDPAASQQTYNFAWSVAADAAGRVHVVWYDQRDGNGQVYYKRSLDGGATWQPDVRLSEDPSPRELPALAAVGEHVYVAWHDARGGEGLNIFVKSSHDGGATWGNDWKLTYDNSSAHVSMAAQGERVHVIWGSHRDGPQSEIYTMHSNDAGVSWSAEQRLSDLPADSWVPTIAVAGQQVYAAWVDTRDGNEEEYFRRSTDGGATWEPAQQLTNNVANSWAPSLAVSGDTVHLVWFDQQDSPFQPHEAEAKLDEAMRLIGLAVEPVPTGITVVHPLLAAQRRTQEKYLLVQAELPRWIARGGDVVKLQTILREFEALGQQNASYLEKERKIDEAVRLMALSYTPGPTDDLPRIYYTEALQIRVQDKLKQVQAAALAWVQRGGDPAQLEALLREFQRRLTLATLEWDIYYRRSTDGGQTWEATQRLTEAPSLSQRPSLAAVGRELHMVWYDGRDGNIEVYYKRSSDAGASWTPDARLTRAQGNSLHPTVAATNAAVYVTWFDQRDGNAEIYFKRTRPGAFTRNWLQR